MNEGQQIPNMTGLDPAQLIVLKGVFNDVQQVLKRYELQVAAGALPAVPPDMVLLTAMSAVLTGAKHWDMPAKDLLSNQLAVFCFTEDEAHLAVHAAFEGRRKAEEASGVSHGPPAGSTQP
jgi:hypothetical protein